MASSIPKIQSEHQDGDRKDSSSDMENDQSSEELKRRKVNNEIEKTRTDDSESETEVFEPLEQNVEVIAKEEDEEPESSKLRQRRVSYGKIPVPPMAVTVEDIQEAAKHSREDQVEESVKRRPVDPRRSSVSIDVFKGFRDPHDKKNMPAKDKTIYVEGPEGKFREMKKGAFWQREHNETLKDDNVEDEEEESVIPHLLKAAGQAFRTQRVYNQVASILQGFLAGVTVMLAVFSFNLNPEVLLDGYRYMSLPIHACFLVAFSVGLVSAIDRTGVYEVEHFISRDRLKATIYNNGLFTFIVWFVGLIATLLCIQLESQLAFAPNEVPSERLVNNWRIFNVFRALTAALGFLLLAFKPDSDTMSKELKQYQAISFMQKFCRFSFFTDEQIPVGAYEETETLYPDSHENPMSWEVVGNNCYEELEEDEDDKVMNKAKEEMKVENDDKEEQEAMEVDGDDNQEQKEITEIKE